MSYNENAKSNGFNIEFSFSSNKPPEKTPPSNPTKVLSDIIPLVERPMSMMAVVKAINSADISYAKIQRAVKAGLIPHYTFQNSKKLIRICDVYASMGIRE